MKLTAEQTDTLSKMAAGAKMRFSRDGDMAWLDTERHTFLSDEQTIHLRVAGLIGNVLDPDDESNADWHAEITEAGRLALEAEAR